MTFGRYDLEDPLKSGAWMQPRIQGQWVRFSDVAKTPDTEEQERRDRFKADARRNLRDRFAGLAMQALAANHYPESSLAGQAYYLADLMLAERDREEPSK